MMSLDKDPHSLFGITHITMLWVTSAGAAIFETAIEILRQLTGAQVEKTGRGLLIFFRNEFKVFHLLLRLFVKLGGAFGGGWLFALIALSAGYPQWERVAIMTGTLGGWYLLDAWKRVVKEKIEVLK